MLKFWAGKAALQFLSEQLGQLERATVFAALTDLETRLIEENLPVDEGDSDGASGSGDSLASAPEYTEEDTATAEL